MADPAKTLKIVIPRGGAPRAIYSPETERVLGALGETTARRASHVEPATGLRPEARAWLIARRKEWEARYGMVEIYTGVPTFDADGIQTHWNGKLQFYADLLPVGGPVLGPFPDNTTAIATEVRWLNDNGIPFAGDPPAPTASSSGPG